MYVIHYFRNTFLDSTLNWANRIDGSETSTGTSFRPEETNDLKNLPNGHRLSHFNSSTMATFCKTEERKHIVFELYRTAKHTNL